MIVEAVKLSATGENVILLTGETRVNLEGRPLRRSNTGGRRFVVEENRIKIWLGSPNTLRDQEMTLTPPVAVVINGDHRYEYVCRLKLTGDAIQIDCDESARRRAAAEQLAAEIQALTLREEQLRRELAQRQQQTIQLEQVKQAEEQRATQLNDAVLLLQRQTAELTQVNGSLQALQGALAQVSAELVAANSQAEQLNQVFADRRAERDLAVRENEINAAAIKVLEEQLADEKSKHEKLEQQKAGYENELEAYGPAVMETLRSEISTLKEQLNTAKTDWTNLSGEMRVWQRQIEDQKTTNAGISMEIEQQPEELRKLQETYETLERRLTETIQAQQMCSEEKQKALREQISEQEPIAQQLTEQYQALEKRAKELEQTIAQQQNAKDEELIRLYPILTQGLAEIMQRVNDTNKELEDLQAEAAQFNQHINTCAERLENLREWYNVDKTPLQKLEERLGEMTPSENEQLLQTMNPMKVDRVRLLFENVESGLGELDAILKTVIKAAQKDEKFTNLRVTTNDEFARREMKKQQ